VKKEEIQVKKEEIHEKIDEIHVKKAKIVIKEDIPKPNPNKGSLLKNQGIYQFFLKGLKNSREKPKFIKKS